MVPTLSNLQRKLLVNFLSILGVVFGLSVLAYFWYPIIKAYYIVQPTKGIDFYLTVSHVTHLVKNFASPMTSWWYQWYGGRPFESVYPVLHTYLILPLTLFGSVFWAAKVYAVTALSLFAALCYLLYYKASRNHFVALLCCLLTIFSYGLYLSPLWGGNVPYVATMLFLPLSLWLAFSYFREINHKHLLLVGLVSGLGMLGHPQVVVAWVIPLVSLLIFFARDEDNEKLLDSFWRGLKNLVIYYSVTLMVGFRQIAFAGLKGVFDLLAGIFSGRLTGTAAEIANHPDAEMAQEMMRQRTFVLKAQEVLDKVPRWVSEPFPYLLVFSLVAVVLLFFTCKDKKRVLRNLLLVGLFLAYGFLFAYLFYMGLNPFAGGWLRVYWGFTVLFGLIISWLLGMSLRALKDFFPKKLHWSGMSVFTWEVLLSGTIFLIAFLLVVPVMEGFVTHILTRSHGFLDKPEILHEHAQESSAYPTVLNLQEENWGENMFKELTPEWLDTNRLDYRLYDLDGTVNIWWNTRFDMPLARGYLDSFSGSNYSGWQYLGNIVMGKDEIVAKLGISPQLAKKQAEFFIDWHAIGFLEGRGGVFARDYGVDFSSYLIDEEMIERSEEVNAWRPLRDYHVDLPGFWETLKYYQVKSEKTSSIYQTTNAPAVLVIGDNEAHNVVMRLFAELGITSQRGIVVQGEQWVDSYSLEELKDFAMVILYRYKYRSGEKMWEMLEKYVRGGGRLFIDTGDERPEAAAEQLPSMFPISSNERESLGMEWDLEAAPVLVEWGVDIGNFTAPVFDEKPWSFSYAETGALDKGARVLLKNHGKVILADTPLGNGRVIWSGMNLPYHIQREHNLDELRLFEKLIEEAVSAEGESFVVSASFERPSPQKAIIKGEKARAVLFKEAGYEGWRVVVKSAAGRQRLKIYKAGPMQPGYMYVIIPPEFRNSPYEVTFTYWGSWKVWLYYIINSAAIVVVIDLITGKHILGLLNRCSFPLRDRFGGWWARDGEY